MESEGSLGFDGEFRHDQDISPLFPELTERLHQITPFELAAVCLHDPLKNIFNLQICEDNHVGGPVVELPMEDTASGWVWEHQQPLAFADITNEPRFAT